MASPLAINTNVGSLTCRKICLLRGPIFRRCGPEPSIHIGAFARRHLKSRPFGVIGAPPDAPAPLLPALVGAVVGGVGLAAAGEPRENVVVQVGQETRGVPAGTAHRALHVGPVPTKTSNR